MWDIKNDVYDANPVFCRQRAVIAELLASKDGEIARLIGERDRQYDENVNRIAAEGAAIVRAEKAESELASKDGEIERRIEELFDWEKIAKRTKEALTGAEDELRVCYSELATLRAENERLKADNMPPEGYKNLYIAARDCIFDANKLGRIEDGWLLLENVNVLVTSKAAERNTAEPAAEIEAACDKMAARMGVKFEKNERWSEVVAATDTAPVVEVTQADRDAARPFMGDAVDYGALDEHRMIVAFAKFRTEAEARGRREALEAIEQFVGYSHVWKEPRVGLAAIRKRLMTEVK